MPTEYKSERSEIKPLQLSETKNYLVEQHNGDVVTGIEADDELEKFGFTGYLDYRKTGKFSYIVCSIDKDSLSTPSLLFNFYKEDGVFKTPQIILIDDSIGDIWVVEKSKKKEVKGWGSYWLAYQMLMGDKTDSIRPYQDFDIKFGDMTCYKLISQCKTQAELFQTVKDQYYEWFPTGVTFTSFDGVDVYLTTDEWLEIIFQLVYMKRWDKDETTFESMLQSYISKEEEV
uniref:Exonuclease n=1 Tax=Klebsiella phage FKP3 TaxID=3231233 RepID=A0AAU8HZL6_9CAUD